MDYFLSLCHIVEEALGADCVQFNIFSQGEPAKFEAFKELRHVRLCLDTNPSKRKKIKDEIFNIKLNKIYREFL